MARCAVRAAFSGARLECERNSSRIRSAR